MAMYFLDSSAIVKRYFQEPGPEWIETLHDPNQGHVLYIAQAALVEVVASICRKAREQDMPLEERNTTIDDFRRDVRSSYSVWVVDNALYTAAGDLCRTHRLRAFVLVVHVNIAPSYLTCHLFFINPTTRALLIFFKR
jgi:uncharacterized protein